jgi:hypothetical protein
MDQQLNSAFVRQGQRLAILQELRVALEQAQAALLASDAEQLEKQTASQLQLCRTLQALAVAEAGGPNQSDWATLPKGAADPAVRQRWSALGQHLAAVERQISHLNRVHAALLRKAYRSVRIFARLLSSSAITYTPPERDGAAATAQSSRE